MEEIKKKKRRTDLDIESLNTAADKLYEQAEASGKICFVTQANSLRRTAKDKLAEKEKLDENLNNKLEELKKIALISRTAKEKIIAKEKLEKQYKT